MRIFVPLFMAAFWLYACVEIKIDNPEPRKDWQFVPLPEIDSDGCCIENPQFQIPPLKDQLTLNKGPYTVTFEDFDNPAIGWEIERYDLVNQWGDVIATIPPNDHHVYEVRGVPAGCYTLRSIGKGWRGDVPSLPSVEACTPGLKTGRIWS